MKRLLPHILWSLFACLGILIAFSAGRRAGARRAEAASADEGPAEPGRETMYTCSMHPQVRTTDPNEKCPICGMELIPVPEDDEPDDPDGPPRLRLSEQAVALMQVQVRPAERREVAAEVRLLGRMEPDETRLRTLAAWTPGRIEALHVNATGERVEQGQPLVTLYSPLLIAAQQELLAAAATARTAAEGTPAARGAEAARERLRQLGLTADQVAEIEARGRAEDRVQILAPADGVVLERRVAEGDYVQTGQPLLRLADLSVLWLQLEAFERDLGWLAEGQAAGFTVEAHPGERFEGIVAFIAPVVGERTRTARVRVEAPNPDGRLKPGMFARATVRSEIDGAPLVVPASAPLHTGTRALVYVQIPGEERPTFEPREIVPGPRAGDWQVVRSGLREGDLVVVHGAFKIDSELQIRGRPSMMAPEGGAPPVHDHGDMPDHADHTEHRPRPTAPPPAPDGRIETPEAFRTAFGGLIRANFALVGALAGDDPDASREAGAKAEAQLATIGREGLSTVARAVWVSQARTMDEALGRFAEAEDLDGMRVAFEPFSDALTVAVRRFGTGGVGPVHRAVCPMVQDREGFWLQPDEDIRNPYWGAAMLECGWVEETLEDAP